MHSPTLLPRISLMQAPARLLTIGVGLLITTRCLAAAGDADVAFGVNGIYVYPRAASQTVATRQIVALSSGRLLALGGIGDGPTGASSYQSSASFALTSAGVLDNSFGQSGLLPDVSTDAHGFLTAQELATGSLILASQVPGCASPSLCVSANPGPTYRVQRYLSNGTLDASFGQSGTEPTASHTGNAAILADGSVAGLGVTYSHFLFPPGPLIYAFDAVAIDTGGQPNPAVTVQFLTQMIRCSPSGTAAVTSFGAPVVRTSADDHIIFAYGSCMLKLNRDATPDNTFGSSGLSDVDNAGLSVTQGLVLKDGSVLTFSLLADGSSYRVVKRLANGAPDPNFGTSGVIAKMALPFTPIQPRDPPVDAFATVPNSRGFPALDNQGRVLIAGYKTDTGVQTNYLARFDGQLNLDSSFGSAGTGVAPVGDPALGLFTPFTAAIDSVGRIVVAGQLKSAGGVFGTQYAEAVTRLQADPVPVATPPSGGGCFAIRNAQVDPTLWGLVLFAAFAMWWRARQGRSLSVEQERFETDAVKNPCCAAMTPNTAHGRKRLS